LSNLQETWHSAEHCWQWSNPHPSNQAHANFSHLSFQDNESHASSLLGVPSSVEDPLWYLDSGATHHITNNSSTYTIKNPYDGIDTVKMSNGIDLKIYVIGSANLRSSTSNHDLVLTNLLHVPDITENLISVSKFCHDNNIIF